MTEVVVFAGPTLPAEAVRTVLPDAAVLPPARQGDFWRAVETYRPRAVGLIDGVFLHEPAVWHREILWALSEGVHVFGAASMGALRAAELAAFGMRGVGRVFAAYVGGTWPGFADAFEDDDEVAVIHAPADFDAAPLSDAMVELRDTLMAAEAGGLLSRAERDALFAPLKALPFQERNFARLGDFADAALPVGRAVALRNWLAAGKVACKRRDAEAMLAELAAFLRTDPPPFAPDFRFAHVQIWEDFVRQAARTPSPEEALVLTELRLRPDEWRDAAVAALGRLAAQRAAAPSGAATRKAFDRFRIAHGLARRVDLDGWLAANAMGDADLARLMDAEAAAEQWIGEAPAGLAVAIADQLRLAGQFAPLLRRARAKEAALAGVPAAAAGPEQDAALAWFADRHGGTLLALRNDNALAEAVWREYVFVRGGEA